MVELYLHPGRGTRSILLWGLTKMYVPRMLVGVNPTNGGPSRYGFAARNNYIYFRVIVEKPDTCGRGARSLLASI